MNKLQQQQRKLRARKQRRPAPYRVVQRPRQGRGNLGAMDNRLPEKGNETIVRGMPGFNTFRYKARLNYFEGTFTLSTGAATCGTYIFSANGLFDPNITSTGHQPMAFDQLMLSYEHYTVTKARLTATARNPSATYPLNFAISRNAGTTAVTDPIALVENGNLVRTRVPVLNVSDSITTLVLPIDIALYGGIDDLLDNPDYAGNVAANPTEQSYFHISVWNSVDATVVSSVQFEAFIEYEAVFSEPRKNSLSMTRMIHSMLISEEKVKSR